LLIGIVHWWPTPTSVGRVKVLESHPYGSAFDTWVNLRKPLMNSTTFLWRYTPFEDKSFRV
jgi:hypothetical protein